MLRCDFEIPLSLALSHIGARILRLKLTEVSFQQLALLYTLTLALSRQGRGTNRAGCWRLDSRFRGKDNGVMETGD